MKTATKKQRKAAIAYIKKHFGKVLKALAKT